MSSPQSSHSNHKISSSLTDLDKIIWFHQQYHGTYKTRPFIIILCHCLSQPLFLSPLAPANYAAANSLTDEYKSVCVLCVKHGLFETMHILFFIHHHPSTATGQNPMPQTIAANQLLLPVKQCDYNKKCKRIFSLL